MTDTPPLPRISVVMPVYNRADDVGSAIQSVLAQDMPEFELIVVDDGSTDDSAAAVASIVDPRIRFLRQPFNKGGNAARNRGIEESKAPLIAYLDSDDAYFPHKLGWTVEYFERNPSVDVLLDSFEKSYRPERDRPNVECRNPVLQSNDEVLDALFNRRIWKATPGITARRETVLRAGGFDESLRRRQDFDFILRLAAVGRCATTDQILWRKSYSAATISGSSAHFVSSTLEFYRRHPEYYSNPSYRRGFAHDIGRHFVRLVRRGKITAALRDGVVFARTLGTVRFLTMLSSGVRLFRKRRQLIGK